MTTATEQPSLPTLRFDNRFANLDPAMGSRLAPVPLPDPYLIAASTRVADMLGLDPLKLQTSEWLDVIAGNRVPEGAQPMAAVYAGHQFGVWAGRLGDGRALLLGDVAGRDGSRLELQLKGSGPTPYSRMGDGRAVLRSSIREFLCSEAMAGLGIPTTRALAVVGSDQPILRETVETAAVVMRVSPSFVRFGNFEYFAHFNQHQTLKVLADDVIDRYEPEIAARWPAATRTGAAYAALLENVARRTASLMAQWQSVGFCHGVMNTDNMSILGLTIDYGPFGFLDGFDANHICNHTDQQGRYAYAMQPGVGEWNCFALAQALMPLIGDIDLARQAMSAYRATYDQAHSALLRAKLGLRRAHPDDDTLISGMFEAMQASHADFTLFFRHLSGVIANDTRGDGPVRDLFIDRAAADAWLTVYRARLATEGVAQAERAAAMNRVNPLYVLRNHLAEIAIRRASGLSAEGTPTGDRDYTEVGRLLDAVSSPYEERPGLEAYAAQPPAWASHLSVSCSS
jgi:uncharacterized protein YdiU (UPF0061 family)